MRNKNKKIIALTTSILLLSIFGSFLLPTVKADVGRYEQRTDPTNPFLFAVDTLYFTSNGEISTSGVQHFYHQVFLEANKHYLFYDTQGFMNDENTEIRIHSAISVAVDYYFEHIYESNIAAGYNLYMNPTQTGLYNITVRWGIEGYDIYRGSYGIGVLEIPIVPLDTEITSDYWDFKTNVIMAVIIELDWNTEYQTGYDGQRCDYLGVGTIYYTNQLYSIPYLDYVKLDGSHEVMNCSASDIITVNSLGYGAGKYLFYSLSYSKFSLMEVVETDEVIIFPIIPIIIVVIFIGIVITIGVVIVLNKRKI